MPTNDFELTVPDLYMYLINDTIQKYSCFGLWVSLFFIKYLVARRLTLVVAFAFLLQKFGKVAGICDWFSAFNEYSLSSGDTQAFTTVIKFVTICNSSCGKVMLLQASVILSTGGGMSDSGSGGVHPLPL